MSVTHATASAATETSGIFAEAVGGIATVVLAIIALSGTSTGFLLATATIVFGAALLIEGTSIVSDFVGLMSSAAGAVGFQMGTGGLGAVFLAGISGIILGILALLGIHAFVLISVAVIVYGSALILSSSAMLNLHMFKARLGGEFMAGTTVSSSAGAQALAGIAAIVLGILAVAGAASETLALVALLVLGAALLATGNGMNNAMVSVFRMQQARG
jgi:hypothetical protein